MIFTTKGNEHPKKCTIRYAVLFGTAPRWKLRPSTCDISARIEFAPLDVAELYLQRDHSPECSPEWHVPVRYCIRQ
jgi:hypothetical protein